MVRKKVLAGSLFHQKRKGLRPKLNEAEYKCTVERGAPDALLLLEIAQLP
jgi:hypothetical protein